MTTALIGERYQVVIPKAVRQQVGLRRHSRVEITVEGSRIVITLPTVEALRGVGRELFAPGTDTTRYVRELRAEWQARERA